MKVLARTAAAALLLAPFVHLVLERPVDRPTGPSALDRVRETGSLRFAVTAGSLTYFFHRGLPVGFEYDLLSGFVKELGVSLKPVLAHSPDEARHLLLTRAADVAILPASEEPLAGLVRTARYVTDESGSGDPSPTEPVGRLFVREDSRTLLVQLNAYLSEASRNGTLKLLYERYVLRADEYAMSKDFRVSPFDRLIARCAREERLDWRLVAAVIAAESCFDADAVSPHGATGLMQLMPSVAEAAATPDLSNPEANIRAGVRYLRRLMDLFSGPDGKPNLPVVLAAYLMGPGHVLDGRQLARELGYDPERWKGGLDRVLPLLEQPQFHERTRFGYAKGKLAVEYVDGVLERYKLYKEHLREHVPQGTKPRPDAPAENAAATIRPPWLGARFRM